MSQPYFDSSKDATNSPNLEKCLTLKSVVVFSVFDPVLILTTPMYNFSYILLFHV